LIDFVPAEEQQTVLSFFDRVRTGESGVLVHSLLGADGATRLVETHAAPCRGPRGTSVVAVIQDRTDRHQLQQALDDWETRFTQLAEGSAGVVFVCQGLRVCFANHALEEITGYTRDELRHVKLPTLVHPDGRPLLSASGRSGEAAAVRADLTLVTKGGAFNVALAVTLTIRPRLITTGTVWAPASSLLEAVEQGAAAVTDEVVERVRTWLRKEVEISDAAVRRPA
jgi:PAS domain S-box-containing protein